MFDINTFLLAGMGFSMPAIFCVLIFKNLRESILGLPCHSILFKTYNKIEIRISNENIRGRFYG